MSFSSIVQISDIDDFITPSLECIKPVQIERYSKHSQAKIIIKEDGSYNEINKDTGQSYLLKTAKITLSDCLACSGCVTTAEEILVKEQSFDNLQTVLDNKADNKVNIVIVSLSTEALSSLAVKYCLPLASVALKVCRFFKNMGVDYVLDESFGHRISVTRNAQEFIDRYRRRQNGEKQLLPMLTSACPGWICYAEKTHGSHILPYIAKTKSGQQILGSLVKNHIYGDDDKKVYHVTLMACFDKKLEASRSDFKDERGVKEVDCVVTSGELSRVIEERGIQLSSLEDQQLDLIPCSNEEAEVVAGFEGEGSGGFLEYVMRYAAKDLFDIELTNIVVKTLKNTDMREAVLEVQGKPVLRFLRSHGFRNIQNVVQKLKRKMKFNYDFVEIMACPSGCLNGGGQILHNLDENSKEHLEKVRENYNQSVPRELRNSVNLKQSDELNNSLFTTNYHTIESQTNALAIRW